MVPCSVIEKSALSAFSEKVLTLAYKNIGYDLTFKEYPLERGLIEANAGRVDGEAHRKASLETLYPNLRQIPVVLVSTRTCLFTTKKDLKFSDWESLRPYHFGILRGQKDVELKTQGMKRELLTNQQQAIDTVGKNHLDFVLLPEFTGKEYLKKSSYKDTIKMLEPALQTQQLFHYLHKNQEKLIPRITEALKKMEKEGEITKIQKEFGF